MEDVQKQLKDLGIRQYAVAEYLELSPSYFSQLLTGQIKATEELKLKIRMAVLVLSKAEAEADKARQKVLNR